MPIIIAEHIVKLWSIEDSSPMIYNIGVGDKVRLTSKILFIINIYESV